MHKHTHCHPSIHSSGMAKRKDKKRAILEMHRIILRDTR